MSKKTKVKAKDEESADQSPETESEQTAAKRGRPAKEPPPPKLWRIEGRSPEGLKVTLGRYVSKEEAEVEMNRLADDGFYEKLRVIESPI